MSIIRSIVFTVAVFAAASFAAQRSGIFFGANISFGEMGGGPFYHMYGTGIVGVDAPNDSIHCLNLQNGGEGMMVPFSITTPIGFKDGIHYSVRETYPVKFYYAAQYSFTAGYEKYFSRFFSVRGAVGYQKTLMDAYGATTPGILEGDTTAVPHVDALIDRHWLTIPLDAKATLPFRRSGIYLAAGPKACILLSTKYKDNISNTTIDLYDRTTGFNLQLGFRVGWETAIANLGYFFIEGGYHTGLIDMSLISSAKIKEGEIVPLGIGFRMNFPQPNKNVS